MWTLVFLSLLPLSLAQFSPVSFILSSPPSLTAALQPNYALYNAEKLHFGRVRGPISFAFLNDDVYAVTISGTVVNLATCPPRVIANLRPRGCRTYRQCGLLTSIRVGPQGQLYVLDAYRGVFVINPSTGASSQIYFSNTRVGNSVPRFLNGMVIANDGTILVSDSSTRFDAANEIYILLENRPRSRIIAINPTTAATAELLRDVFAYPNGLELSADGTRLLVADTGRAEIKSVSLNRDTWLQVTDFATNLPGLPTNIRRSPQGNYWVALTYIRHAGARFNMLDYYAQNPRLRYRIAYDYDANTIYGWFNRYGLIIELDPSGNIIGSLHDPTGRAVSTVSEAHEHNGLLYFGNTDIRYAGRIVLPQGQGRAITVGSVIQVLRSRCQIPENRIAEARRVLQEYIDRTTGTTTTMMPNEPMTTPTTTTTATTSTAAATTTTTMAMTTSTAPATTTTTMAPTTTTTAAQTTTTAAETTTTAAETTTTEAETTTTEGATTTTTLCC